MNVYRALVAVMIGVALLPAHATATDKVLHRVRLVAPLSPMLRDIVTDEFPKDPALQPYLDRDVSDLYPNDKRCRKPLGKFKGSIVPLNRNGDLGAIIVVDGCGWGGTAGNPLLVFLKQHGKWRLAGDTSIASDFVYIVNVLRTTDHGYYRLDLGWERDCEAHGHVIDTDGIMVWKGKTYDRLYPCPEYYHAVLEAPLSPALHLMVMAEFAKDPQLKGYLAPSEFEPTPDHLPRFFGTSFRAARTGERGAVVVVNSDVWCGFAGCPLHVFLERDGIWSRAGDTRITRGVFYAVDVLEKTDHGLYRLDFYGRDSNFSPDFYCADEHEVTTDDEGTMIWTGKSYERFQPCFGR